MLGQSLTVVERVHPTGELGIQSSLEEVARRAWLARNHPKVRNWAIEQLVRYEKETGKKVKTPRQRAEALLGAVQRKLWVPDPIAGEWMAGAHLLACDVNTRDEICFLGSDCDDLSILLTGCFLGVGLEALTVGHGYDRAGRIGHVLAAVKIDGEWLYADPSTDFPLGQCVKFTRERILEPTGAKTICDRMGPCLGSLSDVRIDDYLTHGSFVGVDGPPRQPRARLEWLGEDKSPVEKVIDNCKNTVTSGDLSTAAARAQTFENGAKCAADALCAYYSGGAIPPGVCSSVAGPVVAEVINIWNGIFGGKPSVDCSKVSVVDPCHPCYIYAWKTSKCGTIFQVPRYSISGEKIPTCWDQAGLPPDCAKSVEAKTKAAVQSVQSKQASSSSSIAPLLVIGGVGLAIWLLV